MMRDQIDYLAKGSLNNTIYNSVNNLKAALDHQLQQAEQALSLQAAFPKLAPVLTSLKPNAPENTSLWLPFGEEPWLVSIMTQLSSHTMALLAVRSDPVVQPLETGQTASASWNIKFTTFETQAFSLGDNFPGLKVALTPRRAPARWPNPILFYLAALFLVLGVTLVGAYLLMRDVRRELSMSEMRGQFVSSFSHELKTPLTTIQMFAETLKLRHWSDPSLMDEYLDTIIHESGRLTGMVDNILNFARMERGQMTYQLKPVSPADILRSAALAVQPSLAQQNFRLDTEIDESLPPIMADASALERAIVNLLTNAMKFSMDTREIALRSSRHEGWVEIQVADHGIGIPPAEQKRIFDRFYRVPSGPGQHIPGTGLGLTLAEHIVRGHGGKIAVESEPGKGSTFTIFIPLEAKP